MKDNVTLTLNEIFNDISLEHELNYNYKIFFLTLTNYFQYNSTALPNVFSNF